MSALAHRSTEKRRDILRRVRRIDITTRRVVQNHMAGAYHSTFKGQGIEFDGVRPYEAGDDVRNIDWNVSARTGVPFVKVYREERELTVMLLVDASRSMRFGTAAADKRELAAEIAALLAFSAIRNQDKVGALLFTDRVEKAILPAKGRKHVLRLITEILAFEPEHPGTDVGRALEYLSSLSIRRSVSFVLSDFLATGYETALKIANRKHELTALVFHDEAERSIPATGLTTLTDPETGRTLTVDLDTREGRDWFIKRREELRRARDHLFARHGVRSLALSTDTQRHPYAATLLSFFRRGAHR